jgi:L-asparaginase II
MGSSHNGEKRHLDTLLALLEKASLGESDLRCGTHFPYREWVTQRPLANNCSGKHVATLLTCRANNYTVHDYERIEHPLQDVVRIQLGGWFSSCLLPGLDGCGIPTYGVQVRELAQAYVALAIAQDDALARVRDSYLAEPFYIGGTDRIETHLISKYGFVAKSGSDGVWAAALPRQELGVAVKILSGNENIAAIVMISILEKLGILTVADDPEIVRLLEWTTKTWTGRVAGEVKLHLPEVCQQSH